MQTGAVDPAEECQVAMKRRIKRAVLSSLAALVLVSLVGFSARANKKPPATPIDLNTATIEQLEQLPGVGPVTAKRIIDMREKSGPFHKVEDLLAIRGIGPKRLGKIRPYVIVSPPPKKK